MSPPLSLQFAKSGGHGQPRGANGGQEATDEAHSKGEENTLHEQFGCDFEGKGKVGKSLKIDGAGGQAVEGKNSETTEPAPDKSDEQRFDEKGENDRSCAETKSTHGRDFASTFGHGGIHGIERAENRADRHDQRDQPTQNGDELS